jgi:hypothetical protein
MLGGHSGEVEAARLARIVARVVLKNQIKTAVEVRNSVLHSRLDRDTHSHAAAAHDAGPCSSVPVYKKVYKPLGGTGIPRGYHPAHRSLAGGG